MLYVPFNRMDEFKEVTISGLGPGPGTIRGSGKRRKTTKHRNIHNESNESSIMIEKEKVKVQEKEKESKVSVLPRVLPTVIISPAKKKTKILFVTQQKKTIKPTSVLKTFKSKQLKVVIDNSAKTRRLRNQIVSSVESMTDDQIRAEAVRTHLSKRDKVEKVPISLLRKMIQDYKSMKYKV